MARLEKGLKRKDVAAAINVDGMTIVNWESYPSLPRPSGARMCALSEILGIDIGELRARFPWSPSLAKSPASARQMLIAQ